MFRFFSFRSWLGHARAAWLRPLARRRRKTERRHPVRPTFEVLEDRRLFSVTDTGWFITSATPRTADYQQGLQFDYGVATVTPQ